MQSKDYVTENATLDRIGINCPKGQSFVRNALFTKYTLQSWDNCSQKQNCSTFGCTQYTLYVTTCIKGGNTAHILVICHQTGIKYAYF